MSLPLSHFEWWQSGTNQNSVPANNNALRTMISIKAAVSDSVTAQPSLSSPADDGEWYVIPSGATGAQWSTFQAGSCAIFYGGLWYEFTPVDGDTVNIAGALYEFSSSSGWVAITGGGGGGVTSVNGDTGAVTVLVPIGVACSDGTTALTAGTAKETFRMPFAMNLQYVRANLKTAQTSGSIFTVDINESGASILSTKITIDNGEKTSVTAATAPVLSDTSLADDAEITVDIDQIGDGTAVGLKIWLIGYPV